MDCIGSALLKILFPAVVFSPQILARVKIIHYLCSIKDEDHLRYSR